MLRTTFSKYVGSLCRAYTFSSIRVASLHSMRQFSSIRQSPTIAFNTLNRFANDATHKQGLRFYSAGPAPLTNEFVLERITGVLQSFEKVSFGFGFGFSMGDN